MQDRTDRDAAAVEDGPVEPSALVKKPRLTIRNAVAGDAKAIVALVASVYPDMKPYSTAQIRGQINTFPEGQFVAVYEEEIVGFAATFVISEGVALADHTWAAVTGGGFAARHDAEGDWLYGMEVCVSRTRRRLKLGHRLYEARKRLCQDLGLKGIVFGGRIPGFARRRKTFETPERYLDAIVAKEVKDPTASFQIRAGFEPLRVLRDYNPDDTECGGHALLMVWRNPFYDPSLDRQPVSRRDPSTVRVTTVQLQARSVRSRDEFYDIVRNFVDAAADYQSDFVVFPELFTLQMLAAAHKDAPPDKAIEILSTFTQEFVDKLSELAVSYSVNIIGGSHPTRTDDGDIQNVCYVFLRDGSVHAQEKIHPTPDERKWWNIVGGDALDVIETDCGPIGVLICYDSEFPELARRLVDQGARILFTPFCTDTRQGYLRVRYCCQARAVENQCYVVLSGNVGTLPHVENMDLQYAQSAVLTPCDYPFARDGVAAETSENVEMVAVADVDLSKLVWARRHGSVRNLGDRRFDLYQVRWSGPQDGA